MFRSSPPPPPLPGLPRRRRTNGALLAILALLWYAACQEVAGRAATGLAGRIVGGAFVPLIESAFLLFLVALGFLLFASLRREHPSLREVLSLPKRASAAREWGLGAAVAWSVAFVAVLPMALAGALHAQLSLDPRSLLAALISLGTIALATLAVEATFRGFAFKRLAEVTGRSTAVLLLSAAYALLTAFALGGWALLIAFLFALLLTTGWLRTHALWLSWGLHFAWNAALAVLFGLPLASGTGLSNVMQTQPDGRPTLTGFGLGPIAAPWTALVLLAAIAILVWLTRDLAWNYTHAPIVAAGYPMDVAPPPAHAAMEAVAAPPPLVQILPSTPQDGSRSGPLK